VRGEHRLSLRWFESLLAAQHDSQGLSDFTKGGGTASSHSHLKQTES